VFVERQAAQHAKLAVVDVGDSGAPELAQRPGIGLKDAGEKPCGKPMINMLRWIHENFSGLIG
jgi:hypothetical protein